MLSCHISWPITFWAAVTNPRSSPGVQLSSFRVIIIIIIEPTIVLRSTSSLVGVWMLPSRRWCCLCRWQPLHRNEGWQRTSSRSSCPNCVDRLSLLGRRCCSSLPRVEYVWIMLGLFRNRRQQGKVEDGEISVSHRITFAQGLTSRRTQSFCHPRTTEGNKLHFISCIAVWLISYTSLAIENPIYLDIVPLVNRREGFKWLHRTFNGAVIKE